MKRRFAVVTTCHAAGFTEYGQRMVETFDRHWPADVQLLLYAEGFEPGRLPPRIQVLDLPAVSPALVAFKSRHRNNPLAHGQVCRLRPRLRFRLKPLTFALNGQRWGEGFRWDAVRFAHKSFAIFDAARRSDADVLIWIDADTCFFADVDAARLERFVPPDRFVGFLARSRLTFTESGFVAYNLRHPATAPMLEDFERLYTEDRLFGEYEFSDAWLFDVVRRRAERLGHASHDISEGIGQRASHVLINSSLGEFMDHMKGGRKQAGVSRARDLVVERSEAYWRELKPPPGH